MNHLFKETIDSNFAKDIGLFEKPTEIEKDYHGDFEYLSSSMLKFFAYSGKHFLNYKKQREQGIETTSNAMALGTCVHSIMDEKNEYTVIDLDLRPVPDKDFRTKENANWKKNLFENSINPIEKSEFEKAEIMANSIKDSNFYKGISSLATLEGSEKTYQTELHGLKVKCRVDKIFNWDENTVLIVDWKTTRKQLKKDYFLYQHLINSDDYKYYISMVHYCEIVKEITGKDVVFVFAFVENTEPHDVMPVYISQSSEFYQAAKTKWLDLMFRAKFAIENECYEGVSGISYELKSFPEMEKLEIIKKFSSITMI